ncbi:hypothetical protein DOM21_08155 [Bacteriovorax stolpii]|nr:hypothetical protein DOM21_08155 [Bacteriovorax stolpii]
MEAVKRLGLSETEIKNLDTDTLKATLEEKLDVEKEALKQEAKEKFQQVVDEKIEPKLNEMRASVEKEKAELKKDAIKLGAGYITSTISLFAATLIAPQAIMVCKTKPSAVIYAGSAAIYVLQEMRNIKILKASQLAEIEVVNKIDIDKTKSVKENAKILEAKVDEQVGYIKAYKNTIDHAVSALKKKAKNAKMVSIGFLASSATAAAEQMDWISGGGACVASAPASLDQLNFSPKLDARYAQLIDEAQSAQDKWAYYYEWESLKFGVDRTLSWSEYEKLKNVPVSSGILKNAMGFIHSTLLSTALAAEDTKKVTVAGSLKDNKAADWIGDLDKLGIVGGLATNVVAYMAGWQMGFLKSIIASGTSRAITFGAQGALAFTAGKLFGDAATDLEKKLARIERLINDVQAVSKKGINMLVPSDADARRFQEIAAKIGVPSDKLITEMSINEAQAYLKTIKAKAENLDDEGRALIAKYEEEITTKLKAKGSELQEKVEEKVEEKAQEKAEEKTSLLRFFIPDVQAANVAPVYVLTRVKDISCVDKRSCPPLSFPRGTNPNTKILNQYLGLYENYYQAIKTKNPEQENSAVAALEQYKPVMTSFRDQVFKKGLEKGRAQNTNYYAYERAKINEEVDNFARFYAKLSPEDQAEMSARFNPASQDFSAPQGKKALKIKLKAKINEAEMRILDQLIAKLEASEVIHNGPDMSFVERDRTQDGQDEFNFGNTSIHPKESGLFDIIHLRYQRYIKNTFPDL